MSSRLLARRAGIEAVTALPIFIPDLLAVGALTLIAYVVGRQLAASLTFDSAAESIALCITLGLGTLAMFAFVLGLCGLLQRWAVAAFLVATPAICWRALPGRASALAVTAAMRRRPIVAVLVGVSAVTVAFPMVMLALYPPQAGDATAWHLAIPKLHVAAGRVYPTPYLRYPVFPLANEMLFALMLLYAGDLGAQLVQCLAMLLVALIVFAWGRALGSSTTGLWAAALWLGSPLVVVFGTIAFIDAGLTLFVVASAYCFFKGLRPDVSRGWLVLSGGFVGFAAGSKYSALFFVATFGLAVACVSVWRRRWAPLLSFGLPAVVAAAPWYAYNAVATGNPVFPFFNLVFPTGLWSAEDVTGLMTFMRQFGVGRSVGDFLRLPWDLASRPKAFHSEAPLSPVFRWLLPVTLIVGALRPRLRGIVAVTIAFVVFWFLTWQVARYLFPVLPLLSLLTAITIVQLLGLIPLRIGGAGKAVVVLVVAGLLVFPGWWFALERLRALGPVPTTRAARDGHLAFWAPSYPAYALLNARHGSGYRLYQLLDEQMAYFADGTFMGDWFGPGRYTPVFRALHDGRALHAELRRLRADHFLIWSNKYGKGEKPPADEFFRTHFKPLWSSGPIALYEIAD
jgi:hypothetical protein